jgi:hypothetical protein
LFLLSFGALTAADIDLVGAGVGVHSVRVRLSVLFRPSLLKMIDGCMILHLPFYSSYLAIAGMFVEAHVAMLWVSLFGCLVVRLFMRE